MKYIYIIIAILLFYGCKMNEPTSIIDIFNSKEKVKGEVINLDTHLGNPYQLIYSNSRLILGDINYEYLTSIINIEKREISSYNCKIGQGPNEFYRPINISYNQTNKILYVYERSIQRLTKIKYDENFNDFKFKERISFANSNDSYVGLIRELNNELYIGTGQFDKRYAIFNKNGELINNIYDYPNYKNIKIAEDLIYVAYQNIMEVNNKRIVSASLYCDNIEFLRFENNKLNLIKSYSYSKPKFIDMSQDNTKILHPDDSNKIGFISITYNENYIYCLYSGRSFADYNNYEKTKMGKDVLVFDWNGNPIKRYILDMDVKIITIDNENNIYAIYNSPEPTLVKFKL